MFDGVSMDTWGVTLPFLIVGGGGRINRGVRHFISNSKLFFGGGRAGGHNSFGGWGHLRFGRDCGVVNKRGRVKMFSL